MTINLRWSLNCKLVGVLFREYLVRGRGCTTADRLPTRTGGRYIRNSYSQTLFLSFHSFYTLRLLRLHTCLQLLSSAPLRVNGGELFERVIGSDFYLTEKACQCFVRQIVEGAAFMHSKNVIHLDLKPENILCLTKTGNQIKIIDFGMARIYDPQKKLQILFGTPEFVAPEVVNFDPITCLSDMWSVGVICYVLLSGLSPFMGDTDVVTLGNVTVGRYDFKDKIFDSVSEEAKNFIRKLLTRDMTQRLSAEQALQDPWLTNLTLASELPSTKQRLRRYVIKKRWIKATNMIIALHRMGAKIKV